MQLRIASIIKVSKILLNRIASSKGILHFLCMPFVGGHMNKLYILSNENKHHYPQLT